MQEWQVRPNEDYIDQMRRRKQKSVVNACIIAANLILFVVAEATGGSENSVNMIRLGAAYTPYIQAGEYYRLFTSMFLHFGFQHILNNMLLLFFLGDYMERYLGKLRYLVLYLGGGVLGNLFSYLHERRTGNEVVSAGASGAVFAVLGGLLVLVLLHRGRLENLTLRRVLLLVILSLWVGFQSADVDGFAHLGGFLGGAGLAALLLLPELMKQKKRG